jgi:spermidine synthase
MSLLEAYIITFVASFCSLVIEMVAGRILAPFVGVSLYTWTSIIGVILAGISIGAYIGGKLVDRFPYRKTLGMLLLLSGVAALGIIPLTKLVASYRFPLSLMWRIFAVTAIIFFIPGCVLGTISPVVVRLTLQTLNKAGNVIGKIYAFSTFGAIIGTFATGFLLISWMGTRNIIFTMGIILIITSLLSGGLFKRKAVAAVFVVVCVALLLPLYNLSFKVSLAKPLYYYKESDYFTIKLARQVSVTDRQTQLQTLILDNLIHSYVSLDNPRHIEYKYERIYADVLKWRYNQGSSFKTLSIGGGGYTFPRYLEATYPNAQIEVVEIDPQVTTVVHEYLGLPRSTRIKSTNTDGRWFVMNCKNCYNIIFTDAFNDLSIPYHLTTKEFAQQLRSILTDDGIIISNVIDNLQKGVFLPSFMLTLQQVFGEKNVSLLSVSPDLDNFRIGTFIVVASKGSLDMKDFDNWLKDRGGDDVQSVLVPDSLVKNLLTRRNAIVLTDDYAPVDNLVAPNFEERFGYSRSR